MAARNKMEEYRDRLQTYRETPPEQLLKDNKYTLLALILTVFALWIRLIPRRGMEYMQALDPYVIARMAEAIVTNGSLPVIDVWRYVPFVTPTFQMNLGDFYIPAFAYMVVGPVTGMDFVAWTQFYPALAGALMVLVMYFIGKELFGREAGLFSAFFLAAAPAVLHRSSAGWFEKEPIASLLMFTSIYFVLRAWKRKSWTSGILAGTALGIALTSWGGTQFLVMLFPAVAFAVALIDEDIENLLIAFTPTILIGHFLGAALNPARWSVPNGLLLGSVGVLGLIWLRYLVEEYELVGGAWYKWVVPGGTVLGGIFAFLSPLYSDTLAAMVMGVLGKAAAGGTDVVGGTVAENTPSSAGQIIGQLGVGQVTRLSQLQAFYPFAEFFSGWTFAILGTSALIAIISYMLLRKYDVVDEVSSGMAYFGFIMTTILFSAFMMALLPGNSQQTFLAFAYPLVWAVVGGIFLYVFSSETKLDIDNNWYLMLPLLWILATLYGATTKSRLLFLTSHPVALMAGFGLSLAVTQLRQSAALERIAENSEELDVQRVIGVALALIFIPVIVFNAGAAYSMAQGIGGSPNQLWMQNLDHMRTETPVDSVILSWWDYGYWFETIGARAAIADGGNMGFYHNGIEGDTKINYPLADFLTSPDYTQHLDWLQELSVDYVVLDSTMIGKYSAVSQIHNRDNSQFSAMQTMGCQRQGNRCAIQQSNGQRYLVYGSGRARFLVPINQQGNGLSIAGTPMFQQGRGTAPVQNFCSPQNGIVSFDVNNTQQSLPGCVAFHPYRQHTQLIYIPPDVMESTLVNLYVMDGYNMPHFEEVQDNGFVKMWRVDYDAGSATVEGQ